MSPNPVVWFEIYVQNMDRARKFYETVFQFKLEPLAPPEGIAAGTQMLAFPMAMDGPGSAGMLVKMEGVPSGGGGTLVYLRCDNCAAEQGRVVAAGGQIHRGKHSIGCHGHIALVVDTEGNMIGLHSVQ